MMAERFSIDTNVLLYAADNTAGEKHKGAVELLHAAAALDCLLTIQGLAEFYHAVTRRGGISSRAAAQLVEDWTLQFPTAAPEAAQLSVALQQVVRHGLAFWDALLLETVRAAGCRLLLSEDFQHGRNYGGVLVLDPFRRPIPVRLAPIIGA
jgi:predicted nucleic acid-binding protein